VRAAHAPLRRLPDARVLPNVAAPSEAREGPGRSTQEARVIVVAAVVEEGGRFLVTKRQAGVHLEGLWEFPGGKVAAGEAEEQALRREMLEELDVDVEVGTLASSVTHDYPDRTITLRFYWCRLLGTPRPLLGQEMQWVERGALRTLGFPPADEELIALLTRS
jgi:mutator protein MutT